MAAGDAHVVPEGDLIGHEADEGCVCGPRPLPVKREDGSVGWVLVHSALDGRDVRQPR